MSATIVCRRQLATLGAQSSPSTTPTRISRNSTQEQHQWIDLFCNSSAWWDNRHEKTTQRHPDFRHKVSREPLWLNSLQKPSWVDAHLASLDSNSTCRGLGLEIQTLCEEGNLEKAMEVVHIMDQHGTAPSELSYLSLLKACNRNSSLQHAHQVRAHLVHHGLDGTSFIGDYLVVTLAKCGGIDSACHAFFQLHHRTVFSWTAIISAFSNHGKGGEAMKMYHCMRAEGMEPDKFTFASILKACGGIAHVEEGRRIHADVEKSGFVSDVFVSSSLVSLYGKCGCILEAEFTFSRFCQHNAVSCNAMLSTYVEQGEGGKALQLYRQMQAEGMKSDQRTFVICLQACCILIREEAAAPKERQSTTEQVLEIGQAFHADLLKQGPDVYMHSTLVSLYGKCGSLSEAENVFFSMCERSTITWNEMLSAYIDQSQVEKALQLYCLMQACNVYPDQWTFVLMLQACCMLADKERCRSNLEPDNTIQSVSLQLGEALHVDSQKWNLTLRLFVGNSLVTMYGKCGRVTEAEEVFWKLIKRDTVSWNAMLSAYLEQTGQQGNVLKLYMQMEVAGATPDTITFVCILRAFAEEGRSDVCKLVHFLVLSYGVDESSLLINTLVHAYGSCASMVDAQAIFNTICKPDIVSWNALIAGYALDGNYLESLQALKKMQESGVNPDGTTFVSLFFVCSHAGCVEKGVEYFKSMSSYGIAPERKHFGSLLDLLGRSGDFKSLESVLWRLPTHPDAMLWSSLLGACQTHNNVKLARHAYDCAVDAQPEETNSYVLMANIYAKDGLHSS